MASQRWIADLVGAALSEVDWQEIAEHYVDDIWAEHHEEDEETEE